MQQERLLRINLPALPPNEIFHIGWSPDRQALPTLNAGPHILAKAQAEQISALPALPCIVPFPIGGKGRMVGLRFMHHLIDELTISHTAYKHNPANARQQIESNVFALFPEGALNISGSLFMYIEEFSRILIKGYYSPEDSDLLQMVVSTNPLVNGLRDTLSEALSAAQQQSAGRHLYIMLIDDQVATGFTADFTRLLIDSIGMKTSDTMTVVQLFDVAPDWSNAAGRTVIELVEQTLPFRTLFDWYLGDDAQTATYTDKELSAMTSGRRDRVTKEPVQKIRTAAGVHMPSFFSFYHTILGTTQAYIVNGGYSGRNKEDTPLLIQRPLEDHILRFQTDCGRGDMGVEIDTSETVAAYLQEFDRWE